MWQCASHVSAGALNAGARGAGSGPGMSGTMVKAVALRSRAIVRGAPRVHEADARAVNGKQIWVSEEVLDESPSNERRSSLSSGRRGQPCFWRPRRDRRRIRYGMQRAMIMPTITSVVVLISLSSGNRTVLNDCDSPRVDRETSATSGPCPKRDKPRYPGQERFKF